MLAKTGLAVVLALCASNASTALARPTSQQPRRTPSAPRSHGNFGPSLDHRFYEHGVDSDFPTVSFLTAPVAEDPANIALKYVSSKTNVPTADLRVSSHHTSKHNGVTHVYIQQYRDALEVSNGVANVNIDQNGRVISWGSSLYTEIGNMVHQLKMTDDAPVIKHVDTASNKMDLGPADAVLALAEFLNLEVNVDLEAIPVDHFAPGEERTPSFIVGGSPFAVRDIPAKLKYIQEGQRLLLVWDLEVEMKDNWYNAFVNTETGEVVQLLDWVSDAAYNIFPLGTNDPVSGERVLVTDPAHHLASPLGWHDQGAGRQHTVTIGNNVYAHENLEGRSHWLDNYRPEGTKTLTFDFSVDLEKQPSTYLDAAITNLFYWNNAIHDLLYVYGFDEEAGNFQHDNFGRGGRGGDAVIANAQDGSGYNNANFATPRDGQQPRMRMYVWDVTSPYRDGDLEGGIIMHEYCHGLSIRLTGGPMNVGCLGWGESGGMGEGWGDFFATVTRVTANTTRHQDYGMGEYANGGSGIRKYKYSTDKSVNPSTYKFINQPGYWGVHAKGEVWAEILYEVFWELVDKHGFDPDWFNTGYEGREPSSSSSSSYRDFRTGQLQPRDHMSNRKTKGGNIVALQLVVDGMKLQPCYPTFVEARDAIMQADKVNNKGENLCALWKAFAKRGLGTDAKSGGTESFVVPKKCRSKN